MASPKRGRPPVTDDEWSLLLGEWLMTRAALVDTTGSEPTMDEIAAEMGISPRTLARMREWQRRRRVAALQALGLPGDPIPGIDLRWLRWLAQTPEDQQVDFIRESWLLGQITTREAADRLGTDVQTLRHWRRRLRERQAAEDAEPGPM